jgi:hypothetical protein
MPIDFYRFMAETSKRFKKGFPFLWQKKSRRGVITPDDRDLISRQKISSAARGEVV